ncbi:polysaccharide pyruvyl transferase family protein [Agrococcus casei]|uniref:polysaccharide pyruvyl transferase family protein n=1 Tax=Agrococcus casei TaxID=343512 RepID=UPI003F8DC958
MTDAERLPATALTERIRGVEVFRWMPRRFASMPDYQPENFGDSLAREIVRGMIAIDPPSRLPRRSRRLLSIGSILHFARDSDTVWGSGINGKVDDQIGSDSLDVRAVRGPKTRQALMNRGIAAPEVYGDPGLLLPDLFPVTKMWAKTKRHGIAIVPNFNDAHEFAAMPGFVNPLAPLWEVIRHIAQSEFVIASSLHGIIVAEALGVPVRPLGSRAEALFKYDDYALGTGRESLEIVETVDEAIAAGPTAALAFDTEPLKAAFPRDLWRSYEHTQILEAGAVRDPKSLGDALESRRDQGDELVLCITDASDAAMAPLRTLAAERDGIRLIGTPQTTRGARLTAALTWARGETVSVLGEGERRIPGSLRTTQDALVASKAAMAFTRVQEYDLGPDEYAWSAPVMGGDECLPLSQRPELIGFEHPSGIVFDTDHLRSTHWSLADRNDNLLLAPLQEEFERSTLVLALDTVSTLHRRSTHTLADDRADTLRYFARVLDRSDALAVQAAVLERLPKAWARSSMTGPPALQTAAAELLQKLTIRDADLAQRRTIGMVALTAIGYTTLTDLGFGGDTSGDVSHFVDAARAINRSADRGHRRDAAFALLSLRQPLSRGASRPQLEQLRLALLDLDLPLAPDSTGCRDAGLGAGLLEAALRHDTTSLALLTAEIGDARIESATQTPLGWAVRGSVTPTLVDSTLRLWVHDAGAETAHIIGRPRFGRARPDGRVAFAAAVRSVAAPSGLIQLRPKHDGAALQVTTERRPAGKFVHQMLHPIELPLDGGAAMLVRRPFPFKAVLARYRQQP